MIGNLFEWFMLGIGLTFLVFGYVFAHYFVFLDEIFLQVFNEKPTKNMKKFLFYFRLVTAYAIGFIMTLGAFF